MDDSKKPSHASTANPAKMAFSYNSYVDPRDLVLTTSTWETDEFAEFTNSGLPSWPAAPIVPATATSTTAKDTSFPDTVDAPWLDVPDATYEAAMQVANEYRSDAAPWTFALPHRPGPAPAPAPNMAATASAVPPSAAARPSTSTTTTTTSDNTPPKRARKRRTQESTPTNSSSSGFTFAEPSTPSNMQAPLAARGLKTEKYRALETGGRDGRSLGFDTLALRDGWMRRGLGFETPALRDGMDEKRLGIRDPGFEGWEEKRLGVRDPGFEGWMRRGLGFDTPASMEK
ncbi:MAG: hypothetical protein L6R42_009688 [Xanthoria sp. 1 TBL-2021]|nr:MAG: hypothetical protein L6R42_009688 [Xanthoria sp. 1 TBL-2021]